jgi:hypothetical protein
VSILLRGQPYIRVSDGPDSSTESSTGKHGRRGKPLPVPGAGRRTERRAAGHTIRLPSFPHTGVGGHHAPRPGNRATRPPRCLLPGRFTPRLVEPVLRYMLLEKQRTAKCRSPPVSPRTGDFENHCTWPYCVSSPPTSRPAPCSTRRKGILEVVLHARYLAC